MPSFQIPLWLLMVIMPLPCVLLYRNRALKQLDAGDRHEVAHESHAGIVRLAAVSAAVLVGSAVWFAGDRAAIASGTRSAAFPWVPLGAFLALWLLLGMPVIRRLDQDLAQRGIVCTGMTAGSVRVASLRPRRVGDYLPAAACFLPLVLGTAAPVAIFLWALAYPPEEPRHLLGATVFAAFGLVLIVAQRLWIRMEVAQSYPLAGEERAAKEFEAAAERLRRFRVWCVYWLELIAAAVFFGGALLFLEVGRGALSEATAGRLGGIVGTAVGCCGAVFGVAAGLRALRLNTLRSRIARLSGSPPKAGDIDG